MRRIIPVFGALLLGCAVTNTPPDAPEPPDATVILDASIDAPSPDAFRPGDAWAPDAFTPDAFTPDARRVWGTEICNGVDDNRDGNIDEYTDDDCRFGTIHGEDAYCGPGMCVCRPLASPVRGDDHDDCNASLADGCETPLGTLTDCARCGDACVGWEVCSESPINGFRCSPPGILDFSIGRSGSSEFTCIVLENERVMCRGPNAFFAITEAAPTTATLGWTYVDLPATRNIRAFETMSSGGPALTICTLSNAGEVLCRGNNESGLLGHGDRLPHRGNSVIAVPSGGAEIFIWEGNGYVLLPTRVPGLYSDLWRWGGEYALMPIQWLDRVRSFSVGGNMPMALRDDRPVSWGRHRSYLGLLGPEAEPWSSPQEVVSYGFGVVVDEVACLDDVCCRAYEHVGFSCWGGATADAALSFGRPLGAGYVELELNYQPLIRMVPRGDNIDVCFGNQLRSEPRIGVQCFDAHAVVDFSGVPVVATPVFGPDSASRIPSRVDWQAMCVMHRPDWWQCWGTHEGWGRE